MFQLRLRGAGLLKKVVESIKDLVTNVNFDCSATGISLREMDFSHVAMVALLLSSGGFEHYRCDRNFSMGVNLDNMAKMLHCVSNDDIVSMEADEGGDTVKFTFESPSQDKISDYEMNLMDVVSEHLHIGELQYQAIVRVPASEFARIGKALSTIGDHFNCDAVMISVTNEGVRFSTEGNILSADFFCRANTAVDKKEEVTIVKMEKPVSQTFALRYLTEFTKATPLAAQVTISLSNECDIPILVEYKMDNMGHIKFYLAPKIKKEVTGPRVENVVEVEEGGEGDQVKTIETGDESEPNGQTKHEPEIKLKEEIETDETKPQVEAKEEEESYGC